MTRIRGDRTPAWSQLQAHYQNAGQGLGLREAFAHDAQRFARFSQNAPYIFADLSKIGRAHV